MQISFKSDVWKWHMNFFTRIIKQKNHLLYGVGNRCKDGTYILFLDYDETPLSWIKEEINFLQKRYDMLISTAYIFETRKGFHVVFLDKNDLEDVIEMMKITSCDKHYKEIPLYYGRRTWVLRQSPKPNEQLKYIGCVRKGKELIQSTLNVRSLAHKNYLQQMFNIPEEDFFIKGHDFDEETQITMAYYKVREDV